MGPFILPSCTLIPHVMFWFSFLEWIFWMMMKIDSSVDGAWKLTDYRANLIVLSVTY